MITFFVNLLQIVLSCMFVLNYMLLDFYLFAYCLVYLVARRAGYLL